MGVGRQQQHPDAMFQSFKITVPVDDYRESLDSESWPNGGCTILYRDDLNCQPIYIEHSKRVCGVRYELNKSSICIFNVYMPCDNHTADTHYDYNCVMSDISLYFIIII